MNIKLFIGYFLSNNISSFSSFFFIIWIIFCIIILFIYISLSDVILNIKKEGKCRKSGILKINKKESENLKKNDFISITAHEIKTPVAVIKGYTDLLLNDKDISLKITNDVKEYIKRIENSSDQIFSLVENLLNITKIENNELSLNKEKFNILDLIEEVRENLINDADLKKQTILFETHNVKDIIVFADKLKIEEVLNNLLINAINYTPEGGVIKISVKVEEKFINVSVKDNGIGISYEDQKKIFSKFFRSNSINVRNISGTGLGLYISSSIINMHGGKLILDSKIGHGSTFSFLLPINV